MCAEVGLAFHFTTASEQSRGILALHGDLPHSSIGHFAGSSGGSAVAAAAYRSGEKLTDERTGEQHDYSRRSGVDGSEIIAPEGAPDWVRDRDRLWNAGELSEKRKDSQVAREVRVALPRELAPEQRRELVREFAKAEFTGRGMVADVSYHDGNSGNPHAHILLTTRKLNSDGFGAKDRSWNDKELLLRWREQWAESANRALDRAGSRERIDHRTLAEQRQEAIERGQVRRAAKLDRDPQIHLGKAGAALRRRGQGNERTRRNDRICAGNRYREKERSRLARARWALDAEIQAVKLRAGVARGIGLDLGEGEGRGESDSGVSAAARGREGSPAAVGMGEARPGVAAGTAAGSGSGNLAATARRIGLWMLGTVLPTLPHTSLRHRSGIGRGSRSGESGCRSNGSGGNGRQRTRRKWRG